MNYTHMITLSLLAFSLPFGDAYACKNKQCKKNRTAQAQPSSQPAQTAVASQSTASTSTSSKAKASSSTPVKGDGKVVKADASAKEKGKAVNPPVVKAPVAPRAVKAVATAQAAQPTRYNRILEIIRTSSQAAKKSENKADKKGQYAKPPVRTAQKPAPIKVVSARSNYDNGVNLATARTLEESDDDSQVTALTGTNDSLTDSEESESDEPAAEEQEVALRRVSSSSEESDETSSSDESSSESEEGFFTWAENGIAGLFA